MDIFHIGGPYTFIGKFFKGGYGFRYGLKSWRPISYVSLNMMFRSCWLIRIQTVNLSHQDSWERKLLKILLKKKSEVSLTIIRIVHGLTVLELLGKCWNCTILLNTCAYWRISFKKSKIVNSNIQEYFHILIYGFLATFIDPCFEVLRNPFWTHNSKWPKYWKSLKMFLTDSIPQQFFFTSFPSKLIQDQ